jgi:hypothetical protein
MHCGLLKIGETITLTELVMHPTASPRQCFSTYLETQWLCSAKSFLFLGEQLASVREHVLVKLKIHANTIWKKTAFYTHLKATKFKDEKLLTQFPFCAMKSLKSIGHVAPRKTC